MARKHISWKTKCAAALVHCNILPREDAKLLEEDQLLSLFHWDHNEFYTLESAGRDQFWNLTPMLIKAHRAKTKQDAKIIAKSRRIRAQLARSSDELHETLGAMAEEKHARLRSRGFDKTKTKGFDGKVRPRRTRS